MDWKISFALTATLLGANLAHANEAHAPDRRQAAIRILQSEAQLGEAAAVRVENIVDRYRPQIKTARADRLEALAQLRRQLHAERPMPARVKAAEERIEAARAKLRQLESDRMGELRRALTPTELGNLMLSWRHVNRALRHNLDT